MSAITTIPVQATQVVDTRYTQDVIPVLDTSKFEHMQRIAMMMATCAFVPNDLIKGSDARAKISNCFLIVNQAVRWGMDPFALAQSTYFVGGKIGYEGKVIIAAINSDPRIKGRLDFAFDGTGDARKVVVSGTFKDGETKTVEGTFGGWKTLKDGKVNTQWTKDPDQMLCYRGARHWARRWMPDRLLGIYSTDELDDIAERDVPSGLRALRMKNITPAAAPLEIPDIPDAPTEAEASQEIAETIDKVEAEKFLIQLEENISLCSSAVELAEIADHNANMIARLPKTQRLKAATMLSEAAE